MVRGGKMNTKAILILAVISVLMLTACEKPAFMQGDDEPEYTILPPGEGINVEVPDEETNYTATENYTPEETEIPEEETVVEEPEEETEPLDTSKYLKKVVLEGDLVKLTPQAVDPDGDPITYTFSYPLNDDGEWQTKKGDAGQYLVEITASDGRLETTQKVMVVVESSNKAPVITGLNDITVKEGDTVELGFEVNDPDGDNVTVTISGWMNKEKYTTGYDDAGEHTVAVTASDGDKKSRKTITVTVENVNRAPVIEHMDTVYATEEDEIKLQAKVSDADGDDVNVSFSQPFDKKGEWNTVVGDAGTYEVEITATDGIETVTETVEVIVSAKNQAPVITGLADLEVKEGDTVVLNPVVTDADGDDVEVSFSGWMTTSTYTTDYEDAGVHMVTVTADDGTVKTTKDVKITVANVNRPPEFVLV